MQDKRKFCEYHNRIFTFRTYTTFEKYCNHEKIRLLDFDIFIRFEVS